MRGYSHGRKWLPGDVEREIAEIARPMGRMPTANELQRLGRNDLAVKTQREPGGFRGVAQRLGLTLKGTETHRGREIESIVAVDLRGMGFTVAQQGARAPFDLLVDGVRVDVKSGAMTMPGTHVFALNKVPPTCDMYIAVCVDEMNRPLARYYIPAAAAAIRTLSITPRGKWLKYRDDIGQLRALVSATASRSVA